MSGSKYAALREKNLQEQNQKLKELGKFHQHHICCNISLLLCAIIGNGCLCSSTNIMEGMLYQFSMCVNFKSRGKFLVNANLHLPIKVYQLSGCVGC